MDIQMQVADETGKTVFTVSDDKETDEDIMEIRFSIGELKSSPDAMVIEGWMHTWLNKNCSCTEDNAWTGEKWYGNHCQRWC